MTVAFDPAKHCGAHVKTPRGGPCPTMPRTACTEAGHRCTKSRGWGSRYAPGFGKCRSHGANTPNGRRYAEQERAEAALSNALIALDILATVDPTEALLDALRVACWREYGLRRMLAVRPTLFGRDHQGDDRPDVVASMHQEALESRAKIAKMAIDAGVSAAFVRIAERQAEVTVRAVQAAIDAMIATGDRQHAEAAAADVLEATVPVGAGLN